MARHGWSYKARALSDVERWHKAGWVSDEGARAIGLELKARSGMFSASSVLAILGVVLLGFGAMSFVAANWSDIPKLVRLALVFGLSVASYAGAGALFARDQRGFGHAGVLLGVALFGANIMLVAQLYHVSGQPRTMVAIWAAIALVSGVAFRSSPSLIASLLLMNLWSAWESGASSAIHWMFVPAWLVITLALFWQRSQVGLYLAGAVMTVWLISLGYSWWGGGKSHLFALVAGVAGAVLSVVLEFGARRDYARVGRVLLGFSLIVMVAALSGLQYVPRGDFYKVAGLFHFTVLACIKLAVLVFAMWWCVERANNGVLWIAYVLFSFAVLGIYFKTVGSLLGSAAFFGLAGLVVCALAFVAHLLRARTATLREGQA